MTIKRILCPTDLSTESDEALLYALALTRAYEAKLIIFHCTPDTPGSGLVNGEAKALLEQSLVPHFGAADLMNLDWAGVVAQDEDPGKAISEQAAKDNVDLIVMRSRRRPHRAALLGSTAESVSRTAPCAVLVTHADEREWVGATTREIDLKRVLVAYDFSDYSELALNYAVSFAQEYQSELHLLHVLPSFTVDETEIAWYPIGKEGPYHQAARRLQKAVPAEAHLWCQIKHAVSEGQPYREILNYAERNDIDLICIGAHGAGFGMLTLFGSNVDRVLRQAPCPVLVARPLRHTQAPFVAELKEIRVTEKSRRTISQAALGTSWRDTLGKAGAQALTESLRHMKEQS
jgi:nucleotide-binding universal stress UspA family protein